MSEFKKVYTLLHSQPLVWSDLLFLPNKASSSPCLHNTGLPGESIAKKTCVSPSAISNFHCKECSALPKAIGSGHFKLPPTNIQYARHLITSGKAENTVQVTKVLNNIIIQPLSTNTIHFHLKKAGMKSMVMSKCPLLSARHCKAHLDYAYVHKDYTVEDWKKVIWSDETKINCLGSDECKWTWKRTDKGLCDRLLLELSSLEEDVGTYGLRGSWFCC